MILTLVLSGVAFPSRFLLFAKSGPLFALLSSFPPCVLTLIHRIDAPGAPRVGFTRGRFDFAFLPRVPHPCGFGLCKGEETWKPGKPGETWGQTGRFPVFPI